jgi:glutathione S-transferase
LATVSAVLYWMELSHPSRAARKMLDVKGVEYEVVEVLPLNQRVHMRLAGFRGGTVPALKLDGRRIQGSRAISRALDERWPEPALFPADSELRRRVKEAERWGDERLQPLPRRLFRYGVARVPELRQWAVRSQGLPAPGLVAVAMQPAVAYYARTLEADGRRGNEQGVRSDLAALPGMLDHADELIADGTLTTDPPNAATLQIFASISALAAFEDLHELVAAHACAEPAHELLGVYPARLPRFLDPAWLEPVRAATA